MQNVKDIIILGGGTAGWMAANLMAAQWHEKGINITLVESPEIGVIGVGEGSTPKLKDFFDTLNIEESEWMPACNATYKNGIDFRDWSTIPGFESYFHPFGSTIDSLTYKFFKTNAILRRKNVDVSAHPNHFFLMTKLAAKKLAPIAPPNFPFQMDYAYHFDSVLLGQFLKKKAIERGVKYVEGTVENAQLSENGKIASIHLKNGDELSADYFVDCSGFYSFLLQKTLGVPFKSFSDNLFNDSAVAMPTEITSEIPSQTVSTALSNGWAWEIPLTNRFGNGYVYSSKFISSDQAETELRQTLGLLDADVEVRHLKMKVGRAEKSWHKNCVAIGLSQGFIEPLEATALQFVQTTIESFIQAFEMGNFSETHQTQFNEQINRNFEGIRDYIVLHYKTNSRNDTEYWRANRENTNISSNLQAMLSCWDNVQNLEEALQRLDIGKYYTSISWNCLLAGVGRFTQKDKLIQLDKQPHGVDLDYVDNFLNGCSLNFGDHREQLNSYLAMTA
ncbi:MAG: tryptophan 7-halogenase [Kangiellaceae bacterium]|nr:tryptophan 7-halogenase [Kangiellaceae bacterium]MCW9016672.1 tryptophan 7-halogenase [Kangiellaceae bacterium]